MAENVPITPEHCGAAEHLKAALSLHGADWLHLFCSRSTDYQTFPLIPCAHHLQ